MEVCHQELVLQHNSTMCLADKQSLTRTGKTGNEKVKQSLTRTGKTGNDKVKQSLTRTGKTGNDKVRQCPIAISMNGFYLLLFH